MGYNKDKVDEAVLALLFLTSFKEKIGIRAWKGHDWDALNRLYDKGYISDPKSKAKSIVMYDEGYQLAKELFKKHFE